MVRTLPVISLKLFLRLIETDQSQIYPKPLLCFDSHLLVNISRCSSQHLSVISSKHCLCLQLELRPTGTPVRPKNLDYLGLKTQTLPDHSFKNARWGSTTSFCVFNCSLLELVLKLREIRQILYLFNPAMI